MTKSGSTAIDVVRDPLEPARCSGGMETQPVFDDRSRTVPWMTRTLHRLYDLEAQKVLGKERISIAHWYYLRVLAKSGELNQLELSKRIGIASTTAVPALDSMERRGLLKRTRDPKDRRKYYVSLTGDGRRLVDQLLPEVVKMIDASFDGVDKEELRIFWKVLHRIEQNLTAMANGDIVD
ncbi:MarR family transcriptional regulator [Trinickia terrae]|uniref:MarR family transcriptional regulator n=1 Tax=Trinickia terrae TaxID=2571161 RepID=A0A4U1I0V2_9BURK|nr:MarR family transcriptional regulator [Trinickia terrae]TKC86738.1 MarR family transcriptional regulator [Trinickia terrae]